MSRFHLEYCICNQLTSLFWFSEDEATLVKRFKEERISWSTVPDIGDEPVTDVESSATEERGSLVLGNKRQRVCSREPTII